MTALATRRPAAAVVTVQRSLRVGMSTDPSEAQADAVADAVLRMPDVESPPALQRCTGGSSADDVLQRCPGGCPGEEELRREVLEDRDEEELRRRPVDHGGELARTDGDGPALDAVTAGRLDAARGGGAALPVATRDFFEPRFGADFSAVRVHADERAAGLAAAVNARAFTVGRDVFFGAGEYRPGTAAGDRLTAHELTHILQQGASHKAAHLGSDSTPSLRRQQSSEGPQTFGEVGSAPVDPALLDRNKQVEAQLFIAAEYYRNAGDLRWFFSYAHAMITKQINDNIGLFRQPNALIRLNIHFATEFLRALEGQSHEFWEQAFRECQALERAAGQTALLVAETEACAARMAQVHIHVDLRAALEEIGCIPPQDYGNVLVFVNRGSLAAMVELRGQAVGAAQAMLERLVAPLLDLEVEQWRNAAYSDVCNTAVPGVEARFSEQLQ